MSVSLFSSNDQANFSFWKFIPLYDYSAINLNVMHKVMLSFQEYERKSLSSLTGGNHSVKE